jgi:UDP-N-acetylglucosamine transferase subunit ALG13
VILCTLGTHHQPFARAVRLARALRGPGEELVVQHGATPRPPHGEPGVSWQRWIAPADLERLLDEADLVVTHAGVGAIMQATRAGHRPVVVPRRAAAHEHVDDHQLQIAGALAEAGTVLACHDEGDAAAIARLRPLPRAAAAPSPSRLGEAVFAAATRARRPRPSTGVRRLTGSRTTA